MKQLTAQEFRYLAALKRQRAILDAREKLIPFARFMRPDPNHSEDTDFSVYEAVRHHEVIAHALEAVEAGLIRRLIINCPPRHGKSELASRLFPAWYIGRNTGESIIQASYNEKFSWDFGREVRQIIEDKSYRQIFPKVQINTASVDRVETMSGSKLFFTGRGGSITGRGSVGLVLDDLFKDRVEADSPTTREKVWNWFNQVARTRLLTSLGWIVLINTRWHEDDVVGRLTDPHNASYSEDEARKWRIIDLPALARDNDPLGRKEGEALWPQRFPVPYLEDLRTADPRGFQSLYQGSPTPDKGNFFDSAHIQTYLRADMPKKEDLRFYAASDHAVSTAQDRDKTCCGIMGVDKDANIWIMPDIIWGRYTTDYVVEQMISLMSKFKPLFWWAEKGHISKSIGPFLRKRMLERSVFCPILEVTPTHDKKTRAQAINGRMAQRMVYFPSFAPWWGEARDQLLKFPFGSHDDFVDMLAWLGLGLGLQHIPVRKKPRDEGPKVGTLGWIKAEGKRTLTNSAGW